MPIGFIDDFEGGVAGEEIDEPGLGDYVFTADFDGFEVLFLNVVKHHSFRVADSRSGLGDCECVVGVVQSCFYVGFESSELVALGGDVTAREDDGIARKAE